MTAEKMKKERFDQLGLPPMELAESSASSRSNNEMFKCLFPILIKVMILLLLTIFGTGIYLLLSKILYENDSPRNTQIIVIKENNEPPNMFRFIRILNATSSKAEDITRKKRDINSLAAISEEDEFNSINDDLLQKAKEIIKKHDVMCSQGDKHDVCNLVTKFKQRLEHTDNPVKTSVKRASEVKDLDDNKTESNEVSSTDVTKREVLPVTHIDLVFEDPLDSNEYPTHKTHANHLTPLRARFYSPATHISYPQARDSVLRKVKQPIMHPQDLAILMDLFPDTAFTSNKQSADSSREVSCPPGTIPCMSGDVCVEKERWCDGRVDCADVSDEAKCTCKSRVDKSRLCDGYFDCPFGEDEMGCYGCNDNEFSCEDLDIDSRSTCFTKEQRCDNVVDCPNHKDEIECNMLAPSLVKKPIFAISNTEGFLHRNFKGEWYAVCKNPYMWAHDACRRETGLIIRPPHIEVVTIDPMLKLKYINTDHGGFIQTSDTCMINSSAVYVMCPDMLCGTRVQSTPQLLRENGAIENRLFGRNKRFLQTDHPYPLMFYVNRWKRSIDDSSTKTNYEIKFDTPKIEGFFDKTRNKRTESRVVGGKPSQPAAWPWMVAVFRDGMFHCGGVVLSHNWVISAAHCVHKFWSHYYEVQVGMLRRFSFSPQEHIHKVTNVIVNQHYNQADMKNDLSLLKVEPDILFSRWVRPICLPSPDTAGPDWLRGPVPGTVCTAVGWGATTEHGPDPDHMREVEVPVWKNCKHREDRAGKEICAGLMRGGKDACQGDSGGPLLCRNPLNSQQWYMAGIVSHGDGCGRKDEPGVYTRVSLFVKWIIYHTSSQTLPQIEPIQECPGFKCKSGISKCLPNKRKCDRIIDCLDGADEMNCDFIGSVFPDSILLTPKPEEILASKEARTDTNVSLNNSKENNQIATENVINSKEKAKIISTTEKNNSVSRESDLSDNSVETTNIQDSNLTPNGETISTTDKLNSTSRESEISDNSVETSQIQTSNPVPKEEIITTTVKTNPTSRKNELTHDNSVESTEDKDFQFPSTIEISISKSVEEFKDSVEQVTSDPGAGDSNESTSNIRGDTETVSVTFSGESLESGSLVQSTHQNIIENPDINQKQQILEQVTEISTTTVQQDLVDLTENPEIVTKVNIRENNFILTTTHNPEDNQQVEKSSDDNVIGLLPNSHLAVTDQTSLDTKHIDVKKEQSTPTQSHHKDSTETLSNFGDKAVTAKEIESIVFSELQPATSRRKKHRVHTEFQCRRIDQMIPFHYRCDRKADCEDGTDELDCTCSDYLVTYDEKLICDGVFDCADGHDEANCYSCDEDQFLCKRSQKCIPLKGVCDGIQHCPEGEDELDCFALTNGKEIQYDLDERPTINLEGYLTQKHYNGWRIVCDDKISLEEQIQASTNICRYLGFSSAKDFYVKYINVKEDEIARRRLDNKRQKRNTAESIHFSYRQNNEGNNTVHIPLKDVQVLPERCVPNITKTCKSLYVSCEHSLYNDFNQPQNIYLRNAETNLNQMWPWIAKIFVDGEYKCSGVLVDVSWVLIHEMCLWDSTLAHNFTSVVLGSHRTLDPIHGLYEQVRQVDAKEPFYRNKVILLHLNEPAQYSNLVKPMVIMSSYTSLDSKSTCVAIGQGIDNTSLSIPLEETSERCNPSNICFVRTSNETICPSDITSNRHWAGVISCHTDKGWFPAATFIDSRGECGLGDHIKATEIENLKNEIRRLNSKETTPSVVDKDYSHNCEGIRCGRGRCVSLYQMCDSVKDCEDGNDESENACYKKNAICSDDPYHRGCECLAGQMKCRNGKCVSKELFRDGYDDCGDGTDEPGQATCSHYLARVMPSRLCDGVLNCHDRSDEDPMFCKCFARRTYKCIKSSGDHCVAPDMVCDGIRDCPHGEDEQSCIGLNAPKGTPHGTGQVIVRSHGVWHSKCYPTQNHTKSELEAICAELGFRSGHAKQIHQTDNLIVHEHNNLVLDPFNDITLNNNTIIKMRSNQEPIATAIFDEKLHNCYPVFIECL
ncbi:serine protease nudel [Anticarsia gemmatalis]|uniref:serine protease nudel n=1 Tax=Anticarsia gemmatalis TaxID=129554 RepID=UPI003F76EC82